MAVARQEFAGRQAAEAREWIVAKPVSARRLHEALSSALHGGHPARAEAPARAAILRPSPLAILLAEDNDANRRVLKLMLEELGLDADEATNGTDAIECALTREYDVILMDVQMPGLDGLETTRRIRAHRGGTRPRIVALTANVTLGEEARCLAAGMDAYLSKPLRLDTLAALFRPLFQRSFLSRS